MDPKLKIEELEKKRAAKLEELAAKIDEQRVLDLEARMQLEDEHGPLAAVTVAKPVLDYPTSAFVRTPTSLEYKRYVDMIGKAVEKKSAADTRRAQELLAHACWVYPASDESKKKMLDKFPGLLTPLGLAAAALAEGKAEEEGKG